MDAKAKAGRTGTLVVRWIARGILADETDSYVLFVAEQEERAS